ncbi:MAG: hypothetical protein DRN08_05575 [Thermoplasmata archaeon]|nr:MAG: hypothetical protein DRN08_05575 [Thermoplasmata archaeon]
MKIHIKYPVFSLHLLLLLSIIALPTACSASSGSKIIIEYFYSPGCGSCEEKEPVINYIAENYSDYVVVYKKSIRDNENMRRWLQYFQSTPAIIINNETLVPKQNITIEKLEKIINSYITGQQNNNTLQNQSNKMDIPFLGRINISDFSLPLLTVVLASIDSFNPCSFFVLLFLLSLLVYVKSKRRMLLIGGVFIFFSGFIYFLFMSALLNIFLIAEHVLILTVSAGIIAIILGVINIKDFFYPKSEVSLSISKKRKTEIFKRIRNIVNTSYLPSMIAATVILAVFANTYELFCTLGFPLLFTRTLTLNKLSVAEYYIYLIFYNIVYIIPLLIIVLIFTFTLSHKKLTEWQGRVLKLLSGLMMFLLGMILIGNPSLLNNLLTTITLLVGILVSTLIISYLWKKIFLKPQA